MSTIQLLKKLKKFLPNNTANKLLTDDLIFLEEGVVNIIKFNVLNELFSLLKTKDNFTELYKELSDDLITRFLTIIYKNGGIFLKISDNKINVLFTKELLKKEKEEIILHSVNCSIELVKEYNAFVEEVKNKYKLTFEEHISCGLDYGKFLEIIFGNDKRKERIVLGTVPQNAVENAYKGKNGEILVSPGMYKSAKQHIESCRTRNCYCISELITEVEDLSLPTDDYLNLKTSIIKSFLPEYIYSGLKSDVDNDFREYKEGSLIALEFSGIHDLVKEYIEKFEKLEDETEIRVFTDSFFFGLSKLFKKVFRFAVNFDGAINKIELSKYGVRVIITFSFPKVFENDHTNKLICVEELHKVSRSFKKLNYRIIHFKDTMFASIVGAEERAGYFISSETTAKIDDIIEKIPNGESREIEVHKSGKSIIPKVTKVEKKQKKNSKDDSEKIVLKGLFSHKVIGRNKEIINLNQLLRNGGKIITITGRYGSGKTRLVEEIVKRMANENFYIIYSKVENRDSIIDLFKYIIDESAGITIFDNISSVKSKLVDYFKNLHSTCPEKSERDLFKKKLFILYKMMYNIDIEKSIYDTLSPELRLKNLKEALSLFIIVNYYCNIKDNQGVIFVFDDIDHLMHEEKELMQYVIQYSISHLVEIGNRRNKKGDVNKISFILTYHKSNTLEFNRFLKPFKQELPPLKKDTMRLLLKEMTFGKKMSSEVEKVLLKLSAGNPFHLEQFFKFVYTAGMIVEKESELEKTKYYKKKLIPTDIEEIVKLNLEKLPKQHLEILQAASVIGVKFDKTILKEYYPTLDFAELELITQSNFIKKFHIENYYTFSHPIVSKVLYNFASEANKKEWHKGVAMLLEGTKVTSKLAHPNWLGYHHHLSGNYKKAAEYLEEAYLSAMSKNFIEKALINLQKLITYIEPGEKKDKLLLEEIKILYMMKEYTKARKTAYTLLKRYGKSTNYKFYFDILMSLIDHTISYSPIKKIKEMLHKASKLQRKFELKNYQKGQLYKYYALYKKREEDVKSSVNYLKKSMEYTKRSKDTDSMCFLLNELGIIYETQFRFNKSISTFKKALKIAEKSNNLKFRSILLGNLGKITYKLGQVNDAIKYYNEALDIASVLSLKDVEGVCAGQLGNIYLEMKEITKGMKSFERSIKIFRALNDLEETSYRLADFGSCYIFHNNAIEAEKSFNKAHKIAKEINSSLARAYALMNIGRLKIMRRHYDDAESNLKEALKIYREKKLYKRMGMIYYFLSEMYYQEIVEYDDDPFNKYKKEIREDISKILKYMKYSLYYSKKAKNIHYISQGYLLLGKILNRKDRPKEAINNLQNGHTTIKISDYSKLYINLTIELADAYVKGSRSRDALLVLKAANKQAIKHKDIKSRNLLRDKIKEISNR
ncbi:MAG: tetratricopeptide repeat protein [Candidatus Delongbacteria bacterium]|jgi:tetratricopeptide (TPR) repeat protein|nr:tetratricopeptide repeat protein [Candidatus Delongbacteria bacterium]